MAKELFPTQLFRVGNEYTRSEITSRLTNSTIGREGVINAESFYTGKCKVLEDKETVHQTIELGGDREVTWNEVVKSIAQATGRRVIMTPAPFFVIASIAGVFDRFSWFPAGKDQLNDLVKGSVCDSSEVLKRYDIDLTPFNVDNLKYISG